MRHCSARRFVSYLTQLEQISASARPSVAATHTCRKAYAVGASVLLSAAALALPLCCAPLACAYETYSSPSAGVVEGKNAGELLDERAGGEKNLGGLGVPFPPSDISSSKAAPGEVINSTAKKLASKAADSDVKATDRPLKQVK